VGSIEFARTSGMLRQAGYECQLTTSISRV
jgi:hypothetical protein